MIRRALALMLASALAWGCAEPAPIDTSDTVPDSDTDPIEDTDDTRWAGSVTVKVVDPDGNPLEGVWAMVGGMPRSQWVRTAADGTATLDVADDGITDRMLLAGQEGWLSGGVRFDQRDGPEGVPEITLRPLPDEDGLDYAFQPGGDKHSPDTSECGHCHWTIGSDWAGSQHREAARNPKLWDTYLGGSASGGVSRAACDALGGWIATGQVPGAPSETVDRCYVGEGVLPWLHEGCGGSGEPACDHPSERDGLQRFGSCGDCHAPAVTGGIPGRIDVSSVAGLAFDEGVACDFCHKVREVVAGPEPGLDGGIVLHRPSVATTMPGQQYEPINYGPYADVVVPIMYGSWVPQFREASWCAGCHEYAQPALHPSERVDATRWPDGVPVHETWSEYVAAGLGETAVTCQTCHMPTLDEESSTYDITPQGVGPSVDQGWFRELGEVRHHDFARAEDRAELSLRVSMAAGEVEAVAEVRNTKAGHAVPTGEPLRQLIVLVSAEDDDGPVVSSGGQTAPDVAGYVARGVVGTNATVVDRVVRTPGARLGESVVAARFVRPTGTWDDYAGTGVGWFADEGRTPEEKGLEIHSFLAEIPVASVSGDAVTLAGDPPDLAPGDVVYLVGTDDWAGHPGWVYAKVLVAADGARGVPHFRAVGVASDNRVRLAGKASSIHRFRSNGLPVRVTARLVSRRYAAGPAATYGWDLGDEQLRSVTREP